MKTYLSWAFFYAMLCAVCRATPEGSLGKLIHRILFYPVVFLVPSPLIRLIDPPVPTPLTMFGIAVGIGLALIYALIFFFPTFLAVRSSTKGWTAIWLCCQLALVLLQVGAFVGLCVAAAAALPRQN